MVSSESPLNTRMMPIGQGRKRSKRTRQVRHAATCCDMLRHAAALVSVEPVLVRGDRKTTRQAFLVANLGEQNAGSCTQSSDLSTSNISAFIE